METEWYVRTLEEDEDSGVNNNSSPPRKWSMASRPSLSSLDETLVMDHTAGPVAKLALEEKRGRRKSWHIKMERKRRKGVTGAATPPEKGYQREKRPSWWNIFVPDHWPNRSRRASQDIRPTHTNENTAPWVRSKSRSVDHGFSPPFDLDSLRNKVEGRFESVDKLGRDGEGGKDGAPLAEKKISRMNLPPLDTITYTVVASDTLNSIAARFDITPSELSKLNRLTTRLVFPGQLLYVPDKTKGAGGQSPGSESPTSLTPTQDGDQTVTSERDLLDSLRPNSPHGAPDRAASPLPPSPVPSKPSEQRFLKVNVRHITDGQGVVGGVLLVTPNALMFDPNVSDPLVIEHGPESYGVIAPMEYVVNVAIYYDIAHMRVGHSEHHRSNAPKPEIYHALLNKSTDTLTEPGCPVHHSPGRDSLLVKDETFPELSRSSPDDEDNESVCSCAVPRDGGAFPKAFERDLVTPTNLTTDDSEKNSRQVSFESNSSTRQKSLEEKEEAKNLESFHSAEERRRSCLDNHWMAIPSMDRSVDKEEKEGVEKNDIAAENSGDESDPQGQLVKLSCHDSGIDIRDTGVGDPNALPPLPNPIVIPTKKVYSDADIILAPKSEFVPPLTNTLTGFVTNSSSLDSAGSFDGPGHRKKTSSVSFSVDSNPDTENSGGEDSMHKEDQDKQESRKNKMLKRLSYPLAWMEGFAGDKDDKDVVSSLPNHPAGEAQPHSSMFSKVFSSSPINLVDFSSGLFTKTPSEERPPSITATPPPSATLLSHTPPTILSRSPPSASQEGFSLADTAGAMFGNVGRSSVGTFIRHESTPKAPKPVAPKLDYRSMVSVDDMPELFVSFDKLIPRPARSCEDPPLYLRLRMGKPINKKIPKSTPIMSYGKKKMRPEYWFSVPRNRVDDLYNLLQLWVPQLYGDLDDMDLTGRGYELVESDTELWEEEGETKSAEHTPEGEIGELTRESWEVLKAPYVKLYGFLRTQTQSAEGEHNSDEVLSMSEELRRALYASSVGSLDLDLFLPDLVGVTEILTEEHRKKLCRHLPARAEGYMWTLLFSTSQHGFSLNSMYRKMFRMESPILMVIEDTEHNVFGALTSCALKVSDHFYGTGESLLFRFTPEFQVFNWTGDNLYFIKGNNESLSIGAGDGKFGLWLDGDLNQGRTETCTTYGNEPLSPQEDFVVKTLECWAFI